MALSQYVLRSALDRRRERHQAALTNVRSVYRGNGRAAPGDGAGLVQNDHIDSVGAFERLRATDKYTIFGALPVPTIMAVGVASPIAHGQAIISTATAVRMAVT